MKIKALKLFLISAAFMAANFTGACAYAAHATAQRAEYNLAYAKLVSNVKDQGQHGNCWTFAVMGALESSYLKNSTKALGENPDLSELHTAWFAFNNPEGGRSFTLNNYDSEPVSPVYILEGGKNNNLKAAALFSRLDGPVLNTDLAYPANDKRALPWRPENTDTVPEMSSPDKPYSLIVNGTLRNYYSVAYMPHKEKKPSDYTPALRVSGALFKYGDEADVRSFIKNMVTEYGAVAVTIDLYKGGFYNENVNKSMTYFSKGLSNNTLLCEHNVLITGWNDNFSRDNFGGVKKPENNGAWLVQNSWGDEWGNSGYFWLSYDEPLKTPMAFITEPYDNHIRHYGHDYLGCNGKIYLGGNGEKSVWMASVMRVAGDHEKLREVGFYTLEPNTSYEIYVYKHGNITSVTSPVAHNQYAAETSGDCEFAGYHVVKLSGAVSSVPLEKGSVFSIVLKLTSHNSSNSSSVPLAVETCIKDTETAGAVINEGASFFSLDGENWTDGTKISDILYNSIPANIAAADACLKGFTFIPDQRHADDWLIYRDDDKIDLQLVVFRESAPQNVLVYGTGITDLKWSTEIENDTTTADVNAVFNAASVSGNFYLLKISGRVTESDPAVTLISIDGIDLEMPDGGVKLDVMTVSEVNPNISNNESSSKKSSGREGCNSGVNFISALALLSLIFVFTRRHGVRAE